MSEITKIEWATHSWSPWEGCTKVSPGCKNCYAETRNHRFGMDNWGKGKVRRRTSESYWKQPAKWNLCSPHWERARVFPSLCDWLDDEVPVEWLADFLKLIHDTLNLDWLLLTKRPHLFRIRRAQAMDFVGRSRIQNLAFESWLLDWENGNSPSNVWIGTSVEDQQFADERLPELLKIPAALRFLSVEPLLGHIDLLDCGAIKGSPDPDDYSHGTFGMVDWVIVGGESGPNARPSNIEWIRSIIQQCKSAGVPCFVKQLGSYSIFDYEPNRPQYAGKLKHKKGGDPSEWPEDLRVRQFPIVRDRKTVSHGGP